MTMAAFDYSYESRSYGIFYGLTMLAFFLLDTRGAVRAGVRRSYLWLIGMVIALAAGVSTKLLCRFSQFFQLPRVNLH